MAHRQVSCWQVDWQVDWQADWQCYQAPAAVSLRQKFSTVTWPLSECPESNNGSCTKCPHSEDFWGVWRPNLSQLVPLTFGPLIRSVQCTHSSVSVVFGVHPFQPRSIREDFSFLLDPTLRTVWSGLRDYSTSTSVDSTERVATAAMRLGSRRAIAWLPHSCKIFTEH